MRFLIADGLLAVAGGLRAVANLVEGVALDVEAFCSNELAEEVGSAPFEDYELKEWGWVSRLR